MQQVKQNAKTNLIEAQTHFFFLMTSLMLRSEDCFFYFFVYVKPTKVIIVIHYDCAYIFILSGDVTRKYF
jgi:hypothetical protein